MKHSLWYSDGGRLAYKPVKLKPLSVETFQPKKRTF
jgi:succinate dehydrogenase / fumarate reductase, flavoprotein subunit